MKKKVSITPITQKFFVKVQKKKKVVHSSVTTDENVKRHDDK